MSHEPFIQKKVVFHMEGADAESTFTSYDGTMNGYDDLVLQIGNQLFFANKHATDDQVATNWRTFCRTMNDIRETYKTGFKRHQKTFKKTLMARGHSPREAQLICEMIGASGGYLRYNYSGYVIMYSMLKRRR